MSTKQSLRLAATLFSLMLSLSAIAFAHGDQQHILGTVTKVEAGSISVKTTAGEIKTVMVMPTTKFLKGTAAVSLQDVKVGDRVVIHAKPEGNMLHATEVKIGEAKDSMHHD